MKREDEEESQTRLSHHVNEINISRFVYISHIDEEESQTRLSHHVN